LILILVLAVAVVDLFVTVVEREAQPTDMPEGKVVRWNLLADTLFKLSANGAVQIC
jgi:hypothetical protein